MKLTGSDGEEYSFLLKGHEDLRQDERVMQLFGLVNALLKSDANVDTRRLALSIRRYSVVPLSHHAGLVGWVPNCDTLLVLIKKYREGRGIPLMIERNLLIRMVSPQKPKDTYYTDLPILQKVEVFEAVLDDTTGKDVAKMLWLRSPSSEVWLERRTTYSRSLALMSMVGYVLGLGDRHPQNLMLDRLSGKVVHIDFGDCFDVAVLREKFPERVPFRLTRMLVNAMEVSGVEGTYRGVCESVLRILRRNSDSVMTMLEAFVHDPLINWGGSDNNTKDSKKPSLTIIETNETMKQTEILKRLMEDAIKREELQNPDIIPHRNNRLMKEKSTKIYDKEDDNLDGIQKETLNGRAIAVLARVQEKLTGRDRIEYRIGSNKKNTEISSSGGSGSGSGSGSEILLDEPIMSVTEQVDKLILEARSHENLSQLWMGWMPFW